MKKLVFTGSIVLTYLFLGCEEVSIPKPYAMLRLEYPSPNYEIITNDFPFTFEYNSLATLKKASKQAPNIEYKLMEATLYLSYISVSNNIVYKYYIISLLRSIFHLDTGRERYSLKVPFEYSPDTISAAIIVDKNGM